MNPEQESNQNEQLSRSPSIDSDSSNSTKSKDKNQSSTNLRPSLQNSVRSVSTSNISNNGSKRTHPPPRLKTHNRSLSHNKLVKLSTSSNTNLSRPNLNRSKSTDGLMKGRQTAAALKRNNKSFTKIAGLQPLTKTVSNQSIKSNKSNTSLKQFGSTSSVGIKSSARKGKAIMNLNDDDRDYEDVDEEPDAPVPERFDSQETISTTHSNSDQNIPSLYEQINRILPDPAVEQEKPKLEVLQENIDKEEPKRPDLVSSVQSSAEDFKSNLYGGSLLLSQSTGVVRKIEPISSKAYAEPLPESTSGISFKANPMESNLAQPVTTNQNVIQKNSYQPDQTIFNNLQRTNNQYMQKNPIKHQHSHLQTKPVSNLKNGTNNFNEFLRSNSSDQHQTKNIETRTQQKLWLQRESSLLDVTNMNQNKCNFSNLSLNNLMFSHNYPNSYGSSHILPSSVGPMTPVTPENYIQEGYTTNSNNNSTTNINGLLLMVQNSHQNSIQVRTEFERLNREYLNVRRNLNPVAGSLNRIENKNEIKVIKGKKRTDSNANTFEEYAPAWRDKQNEIAGKVNKIWQDAIYSTLSSKLIGQDQLSNSRMSSFSGNQPYRSKTKLQNE
ncbi:TCO89 [Candida pseudojiufengensis]|uniref:TCO89 n=1 Tax=Candida pseudojiufengensis TaxID=497109 RepID=UPI002224837C|nr:TCO89 [Candida pseudojiufengensis]KAI5966522.1 TCO89 [Candida pseudojiufengensis]